MTQIVVHQRHTQLSYNISRFLFCLKRLIRPCVWCALTSSYIWNKLSSKSRTLGLLVEHTLFNFRFINICIVFISGHSIRGRLPRITYRCRLGETKIVQTIFATSCYAIYANNIYVCVCVWGSRSNYTPSAVYGCPHWKSEPEIGLLLVRERQVKMCASCCENAFFGWLWLCKISSYILIYIYITYSMRSVHTKNNNNHRLTILSIYLYFIHCSISISMPFPSVWLQLL